VTVSIDAPVEAIVDEIVRQLKLAPVGQTSNDGNRR
jgi:hypothetical protein